MSTTENWTSDPGDLLRVHPAFDLSSFDRAATPGWEAGKAAAEEFRAARGALLSEMQERLFAQSRVGDGRSVLLVVQGLDTAGKGGIARHVAGTMDPQGLAIRSFGVPTEEERAHHYLWRIRRGLPGPGRVGIFDRSHYEDVLVVRVDQLADVDWDARFAEINRFERQVVDSGTTVVKVALMVSKQEQGLRLMERLDRPDKNWKFNPTDVDTRSKWDAYQAAYAEMFAATSTEVAPWYVIPADRKWYARLAVTELLAQGLASLDLTWPKVRWRVETQRRRLVETMEPELVEQAAAEAPEKVAEVHADSAEFAEEVATVTALAERDDSPSGESSDSPTGGSPADATATAAAEAPTTKPKKAKKKKGSKKKA